MRQTHNPTAFYTLMAGGFAGTFSWLISFPIDVVKSRLQVDGIDGKQKYKNAIDCVRISYREEGLSFLTRGLNSTLMRAFPMNAVCFLVVSYVMKFFQNSEVMPNIELSIKGDKLSIVDHHQGFISKLFHRIYHNHQHKSIRYLILLDGFHEAACHVEMIDLSDQLRGRSSSSYFYRLNDGIIGDNLSEDEMKVPL